MGFASFYSFLAHSLRKLVVQGQMSSFLIASETNEFVFRPKKLHKGQNQLENELGISLIETDSKKSGHGQKLIATIFELSS